MKARLVLMVLALAVAVAGIGWWLTDRSPRLHPVGPLAADDYVYPGGDRSDRSLQWLGCHPDLPGWQVSYSTDASRTAVRRWYDEEYGPVISRDPPRGFVYEDVTVFLARPFDGLVTVRAWDTTTHECVKRHGEPWDADPVSVYAFQNFDRLALWVDGREYGPDEDHPETRAAPPPGWVTREMALVDEAVAVNPDDEDVVWLRNAEGRWTWYATGFVWYVE